MSRSRLTSRFGSRSAPTMGRRSLMMDEAGTSSRSRDPSADTGPMVAATRLVSSSPRAKYDVLTTLEDSRSSHIERRLSVSTAELERDFDELIPPRRNAQNRRPVLVQMHCPPYQYSFVIQASRKTHKLWAVPCRRPTPVGLVGSRRQAVRPSCYWECCVGRVRGCWRRRDGASTGR